jgi:catechol 2,3-dioxygenase-like lactoylglutathione lyase family enzyme
MIDHVVLRVKSLERSRRFYAEALAPLGYRTVKEIPGGVVFGIGQTIEFCVMEQEPRSSGAHVAFASPDREKVGAFHAAALKAGGRDNGAPGLRTRYHPHYYGAFVYDPDGNNVEAVCHDAKG